MTALIGLRTRPSLAAIACTLLFSLPGAASAYIESEPNDTLATAQSIANFSGDFFIDGSRPFDDTSDDFFSFVVRGLGLLRIESSSPNGSADSIMGLFNASGSLLASNDDGGSPPMSALEYSIGAPGTYRLGFSGYNVGLLACSGTVTQCYDTDGDFVFDTFVAGGGAGGSAGWDYRISLSGPSLVPEPHTALLLGTGLAFLLLRRQQPGRR